MAYTTKIKSPATDVWLDVFAAREQILRYIHIFNSDKEAAANIALAIYDESLPDITKPNSISVVPTGETGSSKYEYFVTCNSDRGETDPRIATVIEDGFDTLDDTNNYHTIGWTEVANEEVTGYTVYLKLNNLSWYSTEVDVGTLSVVNDGTWSLAYSPPWLDMTSISCLLDFEQIPANSILELSTDIEVLSQEKIVFATTNSMINLYARAIDSAS
jgi:hypothetical protein